jgi:hypothetical protein
LVGESIARHGYHCSHAIQLGYEGIKYKPPGQYKPPKILFRKTGKGFFTALDYGGHYTLQVVYQFTRTADLIPATDQSPQSTELDGKLSRYSAEFLYGVVSSPLMEFYYLHRFANPRKQAFPHLLQTNILALPIPHIDFGDPRSPSYQCYSRIEELVGQLEFDLGSIRPTERGHRPEAKLERIEHANQKILAEINETVMDLYEIPMADRIILQAPKKRG